MTAAWFRSYMNLVAGNVLTRDGEIRFPYATLRTALDATTHRQYNLIPADVLELHQHIVDACGTIDMTDEQEELLLLALLNCHMAYGLIIGYTLNDDDSIKQPD